MRTAAALALIVLAHAAHADAPRSMSRAFRLSIGVPLLGAVIGIGGIAVHSDPVLVTGGAAIVLGPTAGHWYAGELVTPGLGVRVAGAGLIVYAAAADHPRDGEAVALTGVVLYGAGALWDLVTLPGAIDDHNARLAIAPTALRDTRGDLAPGLALAVDF